jgi:predicted nucleic acid-binding protein
MTKPKVYLETTIPSYLTAWPSRDLVTAAHQQITREWWEARRRDFALFVSAIVIEEASAGDENAAARRLDVVDHLPLLELSDDVVDVAERLIEHGAIPEQHGEDALHVAVAIVHGMDYLLTWNLSHIAKAEARNRIERTCRSIGYEPPIICTPEELLER